MTIQLIAPYQVEGVEWILKRENSTPRGGILCDEMGLGKTVQMLDAMTKNVQKSTLVVVPKSLVNQWKTEIQKFVPSFSVCIYDGPHRKFVPSDVCVCPYSVVADLIEYTWDRVVLDEGQEIRNPKSVVHKTCMNINAKIKWILTGTPVFNKMRDFVSMCVFIGEKRSRVQAYLDEVRENLVLRRTKTETIQCEFSNVEIEMYEEEKELFEKVCDEHLVSNNILEGILRCRQVCAWPQLYFDSVGDNTKWVHSSAKLDSLICMIKAHPSEKTLIFTQFIGESFEIARRVEKFATVFVLTGQTENRSEVIEDFRKSPEGSVFIIQIKTGGVGLNLQEASRVYITQPSWNPATELQAIARSARTGQKKRVVVKKLIYMGIDTEMVALQNKKSKICSRVLNDPSLTTKIPATENISNFKITLGSKVCVV